MRSIRVTASSSSCDTHLRVPAEPITTVAVADGLGHGEKAAVASQAFCDFVRVNIADELRDILSASTRAIARTRGVAAALVRRDFENETLSFVGVGNIELQAESKNAIRPVCTPGIVGRPLRTVRQYDYALSKGDLIAIFSDGISRPWRLADYRHLDPQSLVDSVLKEHGKN